MVIGASEMAQQVGVLGPSMMRTKFNPWNQHGECREPFPANSSLISYTCTYACTHINKWKKKHYLKMKRKEV